MTNNCDCEQCKYYRALDARFHTPEKNEPLNLNDAVRLLTNYRKLHEDMLCDYRDLSWVVCIDPRERLNSLIIFLNALPDNDPWKVYYLNLVPLLERILEIKAPTETRADNF